MALFAGTDLDTVRIDLRIARSRRVQHGHRQLNRAVATDLYSEFILPSLYRVRCEVVPD